MARKDVPAGVPYKIIDVADLPADREQRATWKADMSHPNGIGIGQEEWFAKQAAKRETA